MRLFCFVTICMLTGVLSAQQVADTSFRPTIDTPEYKEGEGPIVFIDEGHHNFHTKEGRYKAFATLLERDGYQVVPYTGTFNVTNLSKGNILVISNALNEQNVENWFVPTYSAFSDTEIEILKQWVLDGGSLFLIADHMPMGGASKNLAAAFDFEFTDGFAMDTLQSRMPGYFSRTNKNLKENVITNGRNDNERVEKVATFTGQGFKIPTFAKPILVFDERYVNRLPDTAWVFEKSTPVHNLKGWSQGAYANFGKGRIVFFGEAAMFSAQLAGSQRIKAGMNRDDAKENYQLLLNIIHWLDKKFD